MFVPECFRAEEAREEVGITVKMAFKFEDRPLYEPDSMVHLIHYQRLHVICRELGLRNLFEPLGPRDPNHPVDPLGRPEGRLVEFQEKNMFVTILREKIRDVNMQSN